MQEQIQDYMSPIHNNIKIEVDTWFTAQCKNCYDMYYPMYRPSKGEKYGHIVIRQALPDGYILMGKRISIGATKEQINRQILSLIGTLPLLPIS